jgi:uncharacterized membrane protein
MNAKLDRLIHPDDQVRIVDAIRAAERRTSGELKVHLEERCAERDPHVRAQHLFDRLGLHRTRDRNAVLIYVATRDRRFALLGDVGIGEPPSAPFWADAQARMAIAFRRGALGEGIVAAIASIGDQLQRRFPAEAGRRNQIENDISTDDGEASG